MGDAPRRSWIPTAALLGVGYALVGILFARPDTHVQAWRLAAWIVSAVAYAAHIAHEVLRLRNPPGRAGLHAALAVALGAFGLAVGANVHSMYVGSTGPHRRLLLGALVVWPAMTALPAYLVAFGTGAVLSRALRASARERIDEPRA